MAKYDWALIEREYIRGYKDVPKPTFKQLSQRHGCDYGYLRRKGGPGQENWEQKRLIFHTKKTQLINEKELELISDKAVDIDSKALDAAEKGLDIVNKRLETKNLSNHDAEKLSKTASTFHRMGKLALGEPTDHTQTTNNTKLTIEERRENLREKMQRVQKDDSTHERPGNQPEPDTHS